MKRTIEKSIVNNIVYVEPNYVNSIEGYNANGLNTYEFAPSLEDYCLYVNLEVETRGRNIQSSKTANGKKLVLSFVSHTDGKSSINFMQGSKIPLGDGKTSINSLTTNYTDIFLGDLKNNGPQMETFGIKSIDIAYNNYMVPEITIEFVDVRGTALFAQKEYYETNKKIDEAVNSDNQIDIANTFFQCFFTFPYPRFKLFVKGFYGQPVCYELTCADFRARFESSTGNFSCTAKFVGYYFSFLNDVMMNGIVAAPFSDYIGSQYWDSRQFKLMGESGEYVKMPKIATLLRDYKKIVAEAEKMSQQDPVVQEKTGLDQEKEHFNEVIRKYEAFTSEIVGECESRKVLNDRTFKKVTSSGGRVTGLFLMSSSSNTASFQDYVDNADIAKRFSELENSITTFNKAFPSEVLPIPNKFYDLGPIVKAIQGNPNDNKNAFINRMVCGHIEKEHPQLYNFLKIYVLEGNNNETLNPYLGYSNLYYYHDNGFCNTLEKYLKSNDTKTKDVEGKIEKLVDDSIAKALTFRPTVENLTKILMAHFETFVKMIFETAKAICNEEPSRTIQTLGVNDANGISDVKNPSKDLNCIVPPFPKVVEQVRHGDAVNMEETWVGDYNGSVSFKEKDLVHGIINGVSEIAKMLTNSGETGNSEIEFGEVAGSEMPPSTIMKYPLCPIDFTANKNTYEDFDENEPSSLLGLVGLRAIQILSLTNFKDWGNNANVLGKAEACNVLSKHRLNTELLSKLKACTPDNCMQLMYGNQSDSIKKPGDGKKPWPWRLVKNGKGIISTGGTLDICRVTSQTYEGYSVPYQSLSWDKILNEVVHSKNGDKAKVSEDYINSRSYTNIAKKNVFSFDININRINSIAESQLTEIEGIENIRNAITEEAKYDSDNYFLKSDASNIIAYVIENPSSLIPEDGSRLLPSSSDSIYFGKTFGGNYEYLNTFNSCELRWKDKDGNNGKRKGCSGYEDYLSTLKTTDFTITEFPGVNPNLEPNETISIFGEYLYYKQTSNKSKALLFLASLGYAIDYDKIFKDFLFNEEKTIAIIPLPAVLFAGALLWANTSEGIRNMVEYGNKSIYKEYFYKEAKTKLKSDVKNRLIKIFENWVTNGVDGNTMLPSFNKIRDGMELSLKDGITYDNLFMSLTNTIEDKNNADFNDKYKTVSDFLKGTFNENFFRNYITIAINVGGSTNNYTRGLRLGNRDGGPSSSVASNLALSSCIFIKNSNFFNTISETDVSVNVGQLEQFFDGFLSVVKEQTTDTTGDNFQVSQASEETKSNKDIKVGVYRYCKMLYDKWIAGLSDDDFQKNWMMNAFFESDDRFFYFIDAYYKSSGHICLNFGDYCEKIMSCFMDEQYSLLSLLSSVYAKNKFNLMCIQNFIDLGKRENMLSMFDTITYTANWNVKTHPNFIAMYNYETSNYLEGIEGSEYSNDGFMINEPPSTSNIWPEPLKSYNYNSSVPQTIPAFGVSYGKMYQSYFKDIDISMDNPTVTEQSIKAQFAIASTFNEGEQTGDRGNVYTYGQDLYSIYSNNSYTCNVTMMGCAWVQPLMYFVLNNVPMFRGTYLIEKVSHHIEPGNMTTKFMGVRMSNVCTRIAEDWAIRGMNADTGSGVNGEGGPTIAEKLADIDNDCPYKEYPLITDGGDFELSGDKYNDGSRIMYIIMGRGYSKAQAAGIVGNMMQETSLNPKIVACDVNHNYSGGLCMWNAGGLNALMHKDPSNVNNETYQPIPCGGAAFSTNEELAKKLPSASEQVSFLLDSLEKDGTLKGWEVKPKLLAAKTPEEAAVIFQNEFEKCKREYCHESNRKKFAREFYDNYKEPVPELLNNKTDDGKNIVSDLARGFLHALNRTSNSSAVNVEIGYDKNKSKDDAIWLTNPKNDPKFANVFDMILSAYSTKVSDVRWVISDNADQTSVPVAYLVTVKEGSKRVNIKVVKESDISAPLNLSISKNTEDKSGIHPSFCKALVKKYKVNSTEVRRDTNLKINDYDALFKNYKLEDCNKLLGDMGANADVNYGNAITSNFSNLVTNPKMKIVLSDVGRAHSTDLGDYILGTPGNSKVIKTGEKVTGKCTSGPTTWYGKIGINLIWWNDRGVANSRHQETQKNMERNKFRLVVHGNIDDAKTWNKRGLVKPGDICTQHYMINSKEKGYHASSHGCMWTGKDWRSDYIQGDNIMASRSQTNKDGRDGDFSVCLWRRDDLQ